MSRVEVELLTSQYWDCLHVNTTGKEVSTIFAAYTFVGAPSLDVCHSTQLV